MLAQMYAMLTLEGAKQIRSSPKGCIEGTFGVFYLKVRKYVDEALGLGQLCEQSQGGEMTEPGLRRT